MLSRSSGRFMVGCRISVNTLSHITCKILWGLPIYLSPMPHGLARSGALLLSEGHWL